MTVLSEAPQELEETEDPEVQIVLLIAAKQKVCSCVSVLQLKLIHIRNKVIINICSSSSDVFLAFLHGKLYLAYHCLFLRVPLEPAMFCEPLVPFDEF